MILPEFGMLNKYGMVFNLAIWSLFFANSTVQ